MESYLKGRKQTQRFQVNIPPPAHSPKKDDKGNAAETVISAEPMPEAVNAPDVDLVMRDGIVQKIIVHMPDGQRLELDCVYE